MRAGLLVEESATRLARFLETSVELMSLLARACGHTGLNQFCLDDLTTFEKPISELAGIPYGGMHELKGYSPPMAPDTDNNEEPQTNRNPLVPVGLTVLGILILPIFLYSNSPEGPIKAGDVVFSTGRHRVHFVQPSAYRALGYPAFCMMEPRDQLIVTQPPGLRTDGSFVARPLVNSKNEFPFCPPNADLLLYSHQATLRVDTWSEIKAIFARFFSSA